MGDATTDVDLIEEWWASYPEANIGCNLALSGLACVDIDPRNGGNETLERLETERGKFQTDVHQYSGGGGQHFFFLRPESADGIPGTLGPGVDMLLNKYVLLEPSNHKSGGQYEWEASSDPTDGNAPGPLPDWIRDLAIERKQSDAPIGGLRYADAVLQSELREALRDCDADDRDTWVRVGMALRELGDVGFVLWDGWSRQSSKYRPGETRWKWQNDFKPGAGISYESVFHIAKESKKKADEFDLDSMDLSCADDASIIDLVDPDKREVICGLETIKASNVRIRNTDWLWPGRIQLRAMTILAGMAGTGKSTWSFFIAACVSRGGGFPDGHEMDEPGDVILYSSEDNYEEVIVPRLIAFGADLDRIRIITAVMQDDRRKQFIPGKDMKTLVSACNELRPKLLIIDNVSEALSGVDSHKNSEVRERLVPLVHIAEQIHMAILFVSHFKKGSQGQDPLERIAGAGAIGNMSRGVLVCMEEKNSEPTDQTFRMFTRKFNNYPVGSTCFKYRIVGHSVLSRHWNGEDETLVEVATSRIDVLSVDHGRAQDFADEADGLPGNGNGGGQKDVRDTATEMKDFVLNLLGAGTMSGNDIKNAIKLEFAVSDPTAARRLTELRKAGEIHQPRGMFGSWAIGPGD
jgi:hypothetical protein